MTKFVIRQKPTLGKHTPTSSEPEAQFSPSTSESFNLALLKQAQQKPWEPLWTRLAERMCE